MKSWADIYTYHWMLRDKHGAIVGSDGDLMPDVFGFRATLRDMHRDNDGDDGVAVLTVTRETLALGLRTIASGCAGADLALVRNVRSVLEDPRNVYGIEWDASHADAIVQAGLFGEVRYV